MRTWLYALADETERMTDWERQFVESVSDWFDGGGDLTDNQYETLERIYRKFY